jgi:putative sigma-54 modulation protein
MTVTIKGVHYDISDRTQEFIENKLEHLDPFKDLIVDLNISVIKEKTEYRLESNVHFRWGAVVHIHQSDKELYKGIENLVHKLESKVSKEKSKIKDHAPR